MKSVDIMMMVDSRKNSSTSQNRHRCNKNHFPNHSGDMKNSSIYSDTTDHSNSSIRSHLNSNAIASCNKIDQRKPRPRSLSNLQLDSKKFWSPKLPSYATSLIAAAAAGGGVVVIVAVLVVAAAVVVVVLLLLLLVVVVVVVVVVEGVVGGGAGVPLYTSLKTVPGQRCRYLDAGRGAMGGRHNHLARISFGIGLLLRFMVSCALGPVELAPSPCPGAQLTMNISRSS